MSRQLAFEQEEAAEYLVAIEDKQELTLLPTEILGDCCYPGILKWWALCSDNLPF